MVVWLKTNRMLYALHSTLKEVEQNSSHYKYELHIVVSFQRVQYEKGRKSNFSVGKHNLSQVIKVNNSNQSYWL